MANKGGESRRNVIRLRDHWPENHDTVVIRSGEAVDIDVLQQAYEELYLPNFPLAEGNDTLQDWLDNLKDPKATFEYTITIIGDNLRPRRDGKPLPGKPEIKGICVGQYAPDSDTGYLAYIAVDPSTRAEGLGRKLFNHHAMSMLAAARRHGGTLKGLFLDCNDPEKSSRMGIRDDYGAQKRLDKYAQWGGVQVPVDLAYPYSFRQPQKRVRYGTLVAFPHPLSGKYPTQSAVKGFLKSFFRSYGIKKPRKDADFKRMTGELKKAVRKSQPCRARKRHCHAGQCAIA